MPFRSTVLVDELRELQRWALKDDRIHRRLSTLLRSCGCFVLVVKFDLTLRGSLDTAAKSDQPGRGRT